MKNILKITAAILFAFCFNACSEEEESVPQQLEVTPNNISGIWQLSELNGTAIPDGSFFYIEYVRKERKFTIYQKFDSMYPRCITGTYNIEKDPYKGYLLSGKYDYGMGDWNNTYMVTALYENEMVLTVSDGSGEVSRYVRCNEIPAEIVDSVK
ncbi:MAG: lipocalin family protein [Bacteroidaceae bacterium]|nr:lipocalin family protein [Bacteroidaceae bacterium]